MICPCGREMSQRQEKGEKYLFCSGCTRVYNPNRRKVEPVSESSDDELFAGSLEDWL